MPHISLKAEKVFEIFGFPITNSYLTSLMVIFLFFIIGQYYSFQLTLPLKKRSGLFFMINYINNALFSFFSPILGENTFLIYPVVAGFFIYILFQNWLGLLPGVGSLLIKIHHHEETHFIPLLRGATADLNTTISLGLLSVLITQIYGIRLLGIKEYIKKFFNLKNPISFFTGFLEIVSEFSKIFSFGFRLFGNIFAGEVLLTVIAFLLPILASFPFLLLEIFVGFMQAVVFATLTAVFISLAVSKHH
ncbi:MAG: F0F1 ATP synthase subunit A [Patescibacteria group bacterium]|nr:F0F1 ATP synthase subunit A [Patescibacteria group bacterium]